MRVDNARPNTVTEPRWIVRLSAKIISAACGALLWLNFCRGADQPNEDWPQFLGPHRDGTSDETGLLDRWPTNGVPVVWEKKIGTGYGAPSVRGDRLVLHHRVGEEEISVPPPVDSKILFLESAKLPRSDRLQTNIGRVLHSLRSRDVRHRINEPAEKVEFDWVWTVPAETLVREAKIAHRPEDWQILAETARLLSRLISGQQSGQQPEDRQILAETARLLSRFISGHLNAPREVVLESFEGFVDQVEGDTAYVRLKSREHGDVLYGEYPASQLLEKGIEEQGRFLCETVKVDGTTRVDMQAIPSVPATDEQLRAIEEKIDRVLPRDDPGIEY